MSTISPLNAARVWPRPLLTAAVALLLAVHAWLGVRASFEHSLVFDEVGHLMGGNAYWAFNDYRFHPENGNLPQRWAALPWRMAGAYIPTTDTAAWGRSDVWTVGDETFFRSGNDTLYLIAWSHAFMAMISVALGALVFAWSRRLWGDGGGVFSLTLFAFSPTFLAHGPLATSDVTMAFFFLASVGAWWRVLERPSRLRLALSVATTALACLAKFSFVLLPGMLGALVLVAPFALGRERSWTWLDVGGWITLHMLAAWLLIWTAFGWRYSGFAPGLPEAERFYASWELILARLGGLRGAFDFARAWHLFPEAFLQGFGFVLSAAKQRGAFLHGAYGIDGWWWFFPYAFLLKSTLAELVASLAVGIIAFRGGWTHRMDHAWWGNAARRFAPLVALFAIYWIVSLTSSLNIGHRHILPTYPVLFIWIGVLGSRLVITSIRRWLAPVLGIVAAATAYLTFPHYLAYFNLIAGGSMEAHRELVDSSLDWGQDLPDLAKWQASHVPKGARVYVSYFGSVPPDYYGVRGIPLAPYPLVPSFLVYEPLQPGWFCISATMLRDIYSPASGDWSLEREKDYQRLKAVAASPRPTQEEEIIQRTRDLWMLDRLRFARLLQYLRMRPPEGRPSPSWFVFHLSPDELDTALNGSLNQLVEMIGERFEDARPRPSP